MGERRLRRAPVGDGVTVPKDHPRYRSLVARERVAEGVTKGLVHVTGLVAHGRGEAFDYLLGERTTPSALEAARAAAAHLLLARAPVLSVNGNTAVLCPAEMTALAREVPARLEINLFHRTEDRVRALAAHLREHGATDVLGEDAAPRIPGLSSDRAKTSADGIAVADVVLVPLEDGDRAEALKRMGKTVLVVDLNPLSRSAKAADVCIVDEVTRAIPNVTEAVRALRPLGEDEWRKVAAAFDARGNRRAALRTMTETAEKAE